MRATLYATWLGAKGLGKKRLPDASHVGIETPTGSIELNANREGEIYLRSDYGPLQLSPEASNSVRVRVDNHGARYVSEINGDDSEKHRRDQANAALVELHAISILVAGGKAIRLAAGRRAAAAAIRECIEKIRKAL